MPVATNIVLADAQATPVNHTYIPLGKDDKGIFWFEDQSQATPAGFWRISVEAKRPQGAIPGQDTKNRVYRTKITMHQPVLENTTNSTISGVAPAPIVAYNPRVHIEFNMPERSSLQNRADIIKMSPLLLQNANILAVVKDLQFLS